MKSKINKITKLQREAGKINYAPKRARVYPSALFVLHTPGCFEILLKLKLHAIICGYKVFFFRNL